MLNDRRRRSPDRARPWRVASGAADRPADPYALSSASSASGRPIAISIRRQP